MDRKWWTLIAVSIGTFMLLLDVTIVNVALPSIQTSLKASFSDLQWVVDAYALTLAALLLTTGSLADLWGRRRIFVVGLIIFSASSLASGLAQSPLWLNLARGAQGFGGSAMFSTSLALLGSSFQGRERGVAFGVWGAITGLAVAIGPVIGGALTSGLSWRWIFLVNVPIGILAVLISLARVEESRMPHARRPDVIGVVTFSGALGALVYALIKGDTKGWGSSVILGCLIGAGVLLILFLIAERLQPDHAMFDLGLFRKPTFTGGALAAFALSGGLFALFLYLTLYLQDVLGYSALQTGLRFLVLSGGILLTSTLAGRLTAHVPIRLLISPGLVMVGVGLFLLRGVTATSGWTHLIPGFIVCGAGTGLINPPLASTAIGVVRPERAGMASGINSTFRQVGIATGIAGLGAIFTHEVRTKIVSLLNGSPQINPAQAHALAASVASGHGARGGLASLPASARGPAAHALRAGFASGLNELFLVGAILSVVTAFLTLVLIRSKDFEVGAARTVPRAGGEGPAGQPAVQAPPGGERAATPASDGVPGPNSTTVPAAPPIAGGSHHYDAAAAAAYRRPTASAPPGNHMEVAEPQPNTRDVHLVAAAVQSAEEAALAYAREIGEARRHLTAAIEHLDRAEEARALINLHAGGLMGEQSQPAPDTAPAATPGGGAHTGPGAHAEAEADTGRMAYPEPARYAEPAPQDEPVAEPEPTPGGETVAPPPGPELTPQPPPGIAVAGHTGPPPVPPLRRPPGWGPGTAGNR